MRFRVLRLIVLAALLAPAAPGCVFTRSVWEDVEQRRIDEPDGDHTACVALATVLVCFDVAMVPMLLVWLATGD